MGVRVYWLTQVVLGCLGCPTLLVNMQHVLLHFVDYLYVGHNRDLQMMCIIGLFYRFHIVFVNILKIFYYYAVCTEFCSLVGLFPVIRGAVNTHIA